MHFCFIDESGTPPSPVSKKANPYFVISGVIMHESQWHGVAGEVRSLCRRSDYGIKGEIKWRYFGSHNSEADNSVAHLTQAKRDAFRHEFYAILTKRKSIKIVACVGSCAAAFATASDTPRIALAPNLPLFSVPSSSIINLSMARCSKISRPISSLQIVSFTFSTAFKTHYGHSPLSDAACILHTAVPWNFCVCSHEI